MSAGTKVRSPARRSIDGALATFECAVHDVADGGDHQIVIGRVLAVRHPDEHAPPLLFYRGTFTRVSG